MIFQGVGQQFKNPANLGNAFFRQPLPIQGIPLHHMLFQDIRRPDAELSAALGVDPIADRDYGIKIIVINLVCFTVSGSCCIFCNSCLPFQLTALENIAKMA